MLRRAGLTVLAATVLVDMIGFGIVLPLLPFYAEELGASPLEVTLIIASFSAMQLLAAPVWGRVSDRRGRRPLILAGLFASAISYLIFALADSLVVLLLSRIAAGAAGGTISVAQAYVADSTEGDERAHGLGLIGAASGLGVMLGPAIGGFFSRFGLGVPGYVAAALCLANGLAAIAFLPESRHFRDHVARTMPGREQASTVGGWFRSLTRFPLWLLFTVYFLCISAFASMTSVLALYLERALNMGASGMGLVFTAAGAVTVVVRGAAVGRLVRRIGEAPTVRAGTVILALSIATIPLIPNRWGLVVLVPLWALATGILFPSLASLTSQAADAYSQGSVLGGSQLFGGLGRVLGPVWAGLLFQEVGIASPFLAAGLLVGLAVILSVRIPPPRVEELDAASTWSGPLGGTLPGSPETPEAAEP